MRDEVTRIIEFELSSPLARHVYVTGTKLSGDMGHLRVRFVMKQRAGDMMEPGAQEPIAVLTTGSGDGSPEKAQAMLDRSAGYVARVLCDVLQLRKAPKIVFSYDKEYERMKRVKDLLAADHRARPTQPSAASATLSAEAGQAENLGDSLAVNAHNSAASE